MIETALLGASALSSGIGAITGLMNSRTAASASKAQNDVAFRNYYLQQQMARQQREMATAGSVDARGDRVEYVPGVGWVSTPTQGTRELIAASDNEERQRLGPDAMRNRLRRGDNFRRQIDEGQAADSIRNELRNEPQSQDELRNAMIESGVARAMSGPNDARMRLGLQNLRTGASGGRAFADLARAGREDTRTAIADARLNAPDEYNNRNNARRSGIINQSGALTARASAPDDVPFQPNQLNEGLAGMMRSRANLAPQAIGSAMGVNAPRVGSTEDRMPVALDSLGQFLTGVNRMGRNNNLWGGGAADTNRTVASASNGWNGPAANGMMYDR